MTVLGLSTVQAVALAATVGVCLLGLVWWLRRDTGLMRPHVDVLGIHPTAHQPEFRTLPEDHGAVRWVHEEGEGVEEDKAVRIVLDKEKKYPSPFSDRAFYFADTQNGYVFKPEIRDDRIEAIPIDGKKLEDHQNMQEAEHWAALSDPEWAKLARYAPWVAMVIIALLLVLAYGMFSGGGAGAGAGGGAV